ncbi:MAG: septum site-determining protein MinC [Chlorogloeopsis fritschii C42_A2020_084]|uniref:septum site-determining protein MinC n=1 Tax=Chlorogloeopsis fritschii TaxID=1124 RepID=UPI0019E3BF9C|nr:septum site-determining protein MinC [Chlorogloeopsis fritschii]MBF2009197.1 septum site-determining protein MinC [Chlorogloeopsis fritschii C42_A2020_084]
MTSDSAIPDIESNSAFNHAESISHHADVDVDSNVINVNSDSVLPEAEVNSVILYLKSISASADLESNSVAAEPELSSVADADSDSTVFDLDLSELSLLEQTLDKNIHIQIKTEEGKLLLILPTESQVPASENNWAQMWQHLKLRLNTSDRLKPRTHIPVHLVASDRLLDSRQLQELAHTLSEMHMQLKSVSTSRRQTAIAAATAGYSVEQVQRENLLDSQSQVAKVTHTEALYLEKTVRSGVEIRHPGSVIILGDLNPGGIVVADGDILVWGRLRGVAHAGAGGNRKCLIMALQMEPTQLRIADAVARAPEKSLMQFHPEVAYITPQGIRIAKATDFSKTQFNKMNQEP